MGPPKSSPPQRKKTQMVGYHTVPLFPSMIEVQSWKFSHTKQNLPNSASCRLVGRAPNEGTQPLPPQHGSQDRLLVASLSTGLDGKQKKDEIFMRPPAFWHFAAPKNPKRETVSHSKHQKARLFGTKKPGRWVEERVLQHIGPFYGIRRLESTLPAKERRPPCEQLGTGEGVHRVDGLLPGRRSETI